MEANPGPRPKTEGNSATEAVLMPALHLGGIQLWRCAVTVLVVIMVSVKTSVMTEAW